MERRRSTVSECEKEIRNGSIKIAAGEKKRKTVAKDIWAKGEEPNGKWRMRKGGILLELQKSRSNIWQLQFNAKGYEKNQSFLFASQKIEVVSLDSWRWKMKDDVTNKEDENRYRDTAWRHTQTDGLRKDIQNIEQLALTHGSRPLRGLRREMYREKEEMKRIRDGERVGGK